MSEERSATIPPIIPFLRKRDYVFKRELGNGACGQTLLLHDDLIDEDFVCKKYAPITESRRKELFANFVREVKLLYKLHHENVVRVFNHYLYPENLAGYILMEFVEGLDIGKYVKSSPEKTNAVFVQAVSGFAYLESKSILHRDIRVSNILVRTDGTLKIIDLGFGKEIQTTADFDRSVSLNWWCDTPNEFGENKYDFGTEVYFVGKLFEKIIADNRVSHFKFAPTLGRMCQRDPLVRTKSFMQVESEIRTEQFEEFEFTEPELTAYRNFSNELCGQVSKIENGTKYAEDTSRISRQLEDIYRSIMLESFAPNSATVIRCFVEGNYYYRTDMQITVSCIRDFAILFKASTEEKRRLILANLHSRLDAIPKYVQDPYGDEIPF